MSNYDRELHEKVKELGEKLDAHIADEQVERRTLWQLIEENSQQNKALREDTRVIVDFLNDSKGAIRLLDRIRGGVKWLSGFAVLGYVINWLAKHWPFH